MFGWSAAKSERVLFIGNGKKNCIPLIAFKAIYNGILPVYVFSLTTVWNTLAFCIKCLSKGLSLASSSGIG